MIEVIVKYHSDGRETGEIRTLLCDVQRSKEFDRNPLTATKFNELLDKIAQEAFDQGRTYEIARFKREHLEA